MWLFRVAELFRCNFRTILHYAAAGLSLALPELLSALLAWLLAIPDLLFALLRLSSTLPDLSSTFPDSSSALLDLSSALPDLSSAVQGFWSVFPDLSLVVQATPRLVVSAPRFPLSCHQISHGDLDMSPVLPGVPEGHWISPVHSGIYPPWDSGLTTSRRSYRLPGMKEHVADDVSLSLGASGIDWELSDKNTRVVKSWSSLEPSRGLQVHLGLLVTHRSGYRRSGDQQGSNCKHWQQTCEGWWYASEHLRAQTTILGALQTSLEARGITAKESQKRIIYFRNTTSVP